MENHYFDQDGVYTGSAPAASGTLPPLNAIRVPPVTANGVWPVLNATGDGWDLLQDHRGEKGVLNGREHVITALGPPPEGWRPTGEERPEQPATTEALREEAYRSLADPFRERALSYRLESDGWRLVGEDARAEKAENAMREELRKYVAQKQEIRARFPHAGDDGTAVPDSGATSLQAEASSLFLTDSGVYHRHGCRYTRAAGQWLGLDAILAKNAGARECARCRDRRMEE